MSDDLRQIVEAMRENLTDVSTQLHNVAGDLQDTKAETGLRLKGLESSVALLREGIETRFDRVETSLRDAGRSFDTFLSRFTEAMEMVVTTDTEHLRRISQIEDQKAARVEQAALKEQLKELTARVEELERRNPPAR